MSFVLSLSAFAESTHSRDLYASPMASRIAIAAVDAVETANSPAIAQVLRRRSSCVSTRDLIREENMSDSTTLAGLKILLVEDDADARTVLEWLLTGRGATVFAVENGFEALGIIESQTVDVLLSDIGLPGMDGCELLKAIHIREAQDRKGGKKSQPVTAMALSAYTRPENRQKALQAGFSHFLTKPVDFEELISAIVRLVGRTVAA